MHVYTFSIFIPSDRCVQDKPVLLPGHMHVGKPWKIGTGVALSSSGYFPPLSGRSQQVCLASSDLLYTHLALAGRSNKLVGYVEQRNAERAALRVPNQFVTRTHMKLPELNSFTLNLHAPAVWPLQRGHHVEQRRCISPSQRGAW